MPSEPVVTLKCEPGDTLLKLEMAWELINRLRELGVTLGDLPECPEERILLESIPSPAGTDETIVRLRPSEAFLEWIAALRAMELDRSLS